MSNYLSRSAVEAYQRDGVLFPIQVLSQQETSRYRSAYEDFSDRLGGRHPPRELRHPHLFHRWAYDLTLHPDILDAVESIIGPNILVHSTSLFCKNPRDGSFVSWHQDGYYWDLSQPQLVSAWIALSDSIPENGCMRVVRGSHTAGRVDHANSAMSEKNFLLNGMEVVCKVDESDVT